MEVSPKDYINDPRFNRKIEIPAGSFTAAAGRTTPFTLSYADYGYRNETHPEGERIFLFFGPLMGSRLVHIAKDELARRYKIRIIHPDRPGVGGTDPGPVDDAQSGMSLWREVIISLLHHLNIQYVAGVACHSGGTISAIDMLIHHPDIFNPEKPAYLAIGAPWILPRHTGVMTLSLVQNLPASLIGHTDKFARLINNHVGPLVGSTVGFSLGVLRSSQLVSGSGAVLPQSGQSGEAATTAAAAAEGTELVSKGEEADWKFEEKLRSHIFERIYAEGVRGIGFDAMMFMQKGRGMEFGWGDWGDYDAGVKRLISGFERSEASHGRTAEGGRGKRRLRVDVFYAEYDNMIGPGGDVEGKGKGKGKGPRWFDRCWEDAIESLANDGDDGSQRVKVEFRSETVKDAEHDGFWDLRWGAMEEVFKRICEEEEEEEVQI